MIISVSIIIMFFPFFAEAQSPAIISTERHETYYITNKPRLVAAPSVQYPHLVTAECAGATGGDIRGQFFGFSFFRSTEVKSCDCRENAKIYEWLKEHKKAIEAMDVCQPKKTRRCFIFFKCK